MEFLVKTVAFPASLDEDSVAQFQQQAEVAIAANAEVLLVDFSDVEFTNSTGLMALVVVFKGVRDANRKMFLCSVNEQVKMLLELTGMDQVFEIVESPVEANEVSLLAVVR